VITDNQSIKQSIYICSTIVVEKFCLWKQLASY